MKFIFMLVFTLCICINIKAQITGNTFYDNGYRYFTAGEFDKAIEYYTEYLKSYPNDAKAINERGLCYESLREYEYAERDYSNAILISPNFWEYYNNRGYVYVKMNMPDKAYQDFTQSIKLKPDGPEGYAGRVQALLDLGKYDLALMDINSAMTMDRNNPLYFITRVAIYGFMNDTIKLFKDIETILEYYPESFFAGYKSQFVYLSLDNIAKNIEQLTKSIQEKPKIYNNYFKRGFDFYLLKKFEPAIADFNTFISKCKNKNNNYIKIAQKFIDKSVELKEK